MDDDREILAQASDSIRQQREQLSRAGEVPREPKRLTFEDRLARFPDPPALTAQELVAIQRKQLAQAAAKEAELGDRRVQEVVDQVGRRYAAATLANFKTITPESGMVLGAVRRYAEGLKANVEAGVGLVLLGPPGTGKDHLVVAVLKQAAREGFKVHWVDGAELFASARDNIDGGDTEARWSKRFTAPDILAISDPIPPVGEVKEGFQISTLFRIVDRRYREQKPTLITINVADAKEAAAKMSGNIVDRLSHDAVVLKCNWASYRRPQ